ncbi:VOC family protein [Sandaracinus amylolyticus]|uniref:VOC family protein n=1 Tax=Sandaracinus amylolyticus TaxID=927083 RepID=UPI001F303B13|nr:VOC family protein [Sandaracinus amylolyticus]
MDHVGLTVRDLARSVAFYRDVIGLELGVAPKGPPGATLRAGAVEIVLSTWRPGEAEPGVVPRGDHLALRTTTSLDPFVARLRAAGTEHAVVDGRVYLRDPDGHTVEVLCAG